MVICSSIPRFPYPGVRSGAVLCSSSATNHMCLEHLRGGESDLSCAT